MHYTLKKEDMYSNMHNMRSPIIQEIINNGSVNSLSGLSVGTSGVHVTNILLYLIKIEVPLYYSFQFSQSNIIAI